MGEKKKVPVSGQSKLKNIGHRQIFNTNLSSYLMLLKISVLIPSYVKTYFQFNCTI